MLNKYIVDLILVIACLELLYAQLLVCVLSSAEKLLRRDKN